MNLNNTKNKIFFFSAKLFATQSYNDVSLRDIAKIVGIKAPSIYNYYESKSEILEELLQFYEDKIRSFKISVSDLDLSSKEKVIASFKKLIYLYSEEETDIMHYLMKIVFKEQFWNPHAKDIVLRLSLEERFDDIMEFFKILSNKNILKIDNAKYYAEIITRLPLTYALQVVLRGDLTSDNYGVTMEELLNFILDQMIFRELKY